jgi:hypothetical protein
VSMKNFIRKQSLSDLCSGCGKCPYGGRRIYPEAV